MNRTIITSTTFFLFLISTGLSKAEMSIRFPDAETTMMRALTNGQRIFFLKQDDGYYYPVGVPKNAILESMPPQIDVVVLRDNQALRVGVGVLEPLSAELFETGHVEAYQLDGWKPVNTTVFHEGNILAPLAKQPPIWQTIRFGDLRFKPAKLREEQKLKGNNNE